MSFSKMENCQAKDAKKESALVGNDLSVFLVAFVMLTFGSSLTKSLCLMIELPNGSMVQPLFRWCFDFSPSPSGIDFRLVESGSRAKVFMINIRLAVFHRHVRSFSGAGGGGELSMNVNDTVCTTSDGVVVQFFAKLNVRTFCRACIDWSESDTHDSLKRYLLNFHLVSNANDWEWFVIGLTHSFRIEKLALNRAELSSSRFGRKIPRTKTFWWQILTELDISTWTHVNLINFELKFMSL